MGLRGEWEGKAEDEGEASGKVVDVGVVGALVAVVDGADKGDGRDGWSVAFCFPLSPTEAVLGCVGGIETTGFILRSCGMVSRVCEGDHDES